MNLRFLRRAKNDRTFQYWDETSKGNIEQTMKKICDGYDSESFKNKKDSIIFTFPIKFTKDDVVLDLACGLGRTCKWVAPNVKEYIGIDFIPKMIERARLYNKNYDNASFFVNDGMKLPMISNESIDVVYCELGFQHMLKSVQKSYVKEIFRVMKPNGVFYGQLPKISFFKDESYSLNDKEIMELLKDFTLTWIKVSDGTHNAYYTFEARKTDLKESGSFYID